MKIAIIGAGPGGLTLANLLKCKNIPFSIYEREEADNHRDQGGTLDLHRESGQLALKHAGLLAEFQRLSRPEGDALKIVAKDGKVLWDENVGMEEKKKDKKKMEELERPEIDRAVLRDMLLKAVGGKDSITWGKKLDHLEQQQQRFSLHFEDGTVESGFDLVVGADGAWSRVRPYLTKLKPHYGGVSMVELWAKQLEEIHPWLSQYVGAGSLMVLDQDRAIFGQRCGDDSARVYACLRRPEEDDWLEKLKKGEEDVKAALVREHFADCGDDLKRMIAECTDGTIPRKLYMLPIGTRWEAKPGVTLIGDAAHLMTPFAGEGVNQAMKDALELSEAIVCMMVNPSRVGELLRGYEESMFERGRDNAQETWDRMQMCFSERGGEEMAEMMRAHHGPQQE